MGRKTRNDGGKGSRWKASRQHGNVAHRGYFGGLQTPNLGISGGVKAY